MTTQANFWDRIAPKYAKTPIKDLDHYHHTLSRTQSYLRSSDHVLEIGCGTGSTALLLAASVARIVGTDISSGMIEIARGKLGAEHKNLEFEVVDIFESCAQNPGQDAILAHSLLHLLKDVPGSLNAIHGALKPEGLFVSKSACLGDGGWYINPMIKVMQLFGKAPYAAVFTVEELERMIENAGFEIVETETKSGMVPVRYIVARKL